MFKIMLVVLFCLVALSDLVQARDVQPLAVNDILNARSFGEVYPLSLSPNGKWLAYTIQRRERSDIRSQGTWQETGELPFVRGLDVLVVNTETQQSHAITNGQGDNWLPTWSPDGRFLAFFSTRDGSQQPKLWIWDAMKDYLRKVSDTTVRSFDLKWDPRGRTILFTTLPDAHSTATLRHRHFSLMEASDSIDASTSGVDAAQPTVWLYSSAVPPSSDGSRSEGDAWDLNDKLGTLVIANLDNGEIHAIVRNRRINTFRISPDGSSVAYTVSKRFERPGSQQILYDLVITSIADHKERVIATDIRQGFDGSSFTWSPNGSFISYRDTGPGDTVTHNCFIIDIVNGSTRNVTMLSPSQKLSRYESGLPLWDKSSHNIYFVHNGGLWKASINGDAAAECARVPQRQIMWWLIAASDGSTLTTSGNMETIVVAHDDVNKSDGFYKVDLSSGKATKLRENNECYSCSSIRQPVVATEDGKHVLFFAENAQHEPDIWLSDAAFNSPHPITNLNPQLDKYELGSTKLVSWLSDDGQLLHGAVLLPVGFEEGKRYPLIVYVYGGAQLSSKIHHFGLIDSTVFNMQLFATRGYAVLCPDVPQSVGTPMVDIERTVLPGINKLIEMGIADPARLGVMGHSYGGYSALALIVQSRRFQAAVMADGYGDLIGNYGSMDKDGSAFGTSIQEKGQGLMAGTPWQFRERYIENSPVFYLDRVETPLLILHGADDTDVLPFLADEIFVSLRRLGKTVEYAKYDHEGHVPSSWSYPNQVDVCKRSINWFDKYLKRNLQ
jgi:dipeptidyl aminopeptidase/acylaminoacyl peptidase